MNVKIMSMQRVVNYGSFMQAYALKRVVESMGHQARFVDFPHGAPRHVGEKVRTATLGDRLRKLPSLLKNPGYFLRRRLFNKHLREAFYRGAWPVLGLTPEPDYDTRCDLLIIGSDEVFNYTQNHTYGYVPQLFGHGLESSRLISYAASAGYATPRDVEQDGLVDELRSGFARFNALAVRDENTFELVSRYSPQPPTLTLDPTLIYDFHREMEGCKTLQDCLLIYAYEGRLDSPSDIQQIRAFAKANSLRIVSIGFYHEWCDQNLTVEPLQLLSVFASAKYVITDTFHGTIFSIKSKKPFLTLLRKESRWGSNFNKVSFLLGQLGLSYRSSDRVDHLLEKLAEPIDFDAVDLRLAPLRERSLRYLREQTENS